MNTKRFGPADENDVKAVEVNLDAFKDMKSVEDLKKEPGKIFGHFSPEVENAAYDELAQALGLTKVPAGATAKPAPTPQPAQ